jgi:uncharacterized protein (TIGR00251 family)
MIPLRQTASGISFAVRVQPRAHRTAITGVLGEGDTAALKISLAAPAMEGRANDALVRLIAESLDVPRSSVKIVSGSQSRNKVVQIMGADFERVWTKLKEFLPSG